MPHTILTLFTMLTLQAVSAQAQTLLPPMCNDPSLDLRKVGVGFQCRTTTAVVYERVAVEGYGEAWMGPDRRVWGESIGKFKYVNEAGLMNPCPVGGFVPHKELFLTGEKNHFREVLPGMDRFYWTSSLAYRFGADRDSGSVFYYFLPQQGDFRVAIAKASVDVRCVTAKHP